jgi:hypothetical protein
MNAMNEGRFTAETINHNQKVQTSMNPEGFEPEISEARAPEACLRTRDHRDWLLVFPSFIILSSVSLNFSLAYVPLLKISLHHFLSSLPASPFLIFLSLFLFS